MVIVRSLKVRDSKRVCELIREAFEESDKRLGINFEKYHIHYCLAGLLNKILTILNLDFFKVFVAEVDGKVVGSITTYCVEKDVWRAVRLSVDYSVRGQGIGSLLYKKRIDFAAQKKGKYIVAEHTCDNLPAIHVWQNKYKANWLRVHFIFLFDPQKKECQLNDNICNRIDVKKVGKRIPDMISGQKDIQKQIVISKESLRASLFYCVLNKIIPPTTYDSFYYEKSNQLFAFARIGRMYPANIFCIDYVWYKKEIEKNDLKAFILKILEYTSRRTKNKIWLCAIEGNNLLMEICHDLNMSIYAKSYYYRIPVEKLVN